MRAYGVLIFHVLEIGTYVDFSETKDSGSVPVYLQFSRRTVSAVCKTVSHRCTCPWPFFSSFSSVPLQARVSSQASGKPSTIFTSSSLDPEPWMRRAVGIASALVVLCWLSWVCRAPPCVGPGEDPGPVPPEAVVDPGGAVLLGLREVGSSPGDAPWDFPLILLLPEVESKQSRSSARACCFGARPQMMSRVFCRDGRATGDGPGPSPSIHLSIHPSIHHSAPPHHKTEDIILGHWWVARRCRAIRTTRRSSLGRESVSQESVTRPLPRSGSRRGKEKNKIATGGWY
ncbi:hypothetical protein B0H67DRAFT_298277 [Lasiosphaeris hirsuta]|uniref:Uncharacterized protein n=1 Tax=Lasiosphaeris hirsuta TaxID=260670 RepID=A0AA40A9C1_9PEZI|nr:hypothetical protein B0H67DRAFT_298277 [Lasiosphaeris hirsuta]